jgi:hypothetical protein
MPEVRVMMAAPATDWWAIEVKCATPTGRGCIGLSRDRSIAGGWKIDIDVEGKAKPTETPTTGADDG